MVDRGEDALNPPFSPELLADLHGGALAPHVADPLRDAIAGDPDAQGTLNALDRVRSDLGALRTNPPTPPPIPPDVLARVHAALAADVTPPVAPVSSVTEMAARRQRSMRLMATAAAALVVVTLGGIAVTTFPRSGTDPSPVPGGDVVAGSATTVQLGDDIRPSAALTVLGRTSLGRLGDPGTRSECLRANGIDPATPMLGSSPVQIRGIAGQLVLLPGSATPKILVLVVGSRCSTGNPDTIARTEIG